eukprot:COSAG01_NODE_664_length_14417_cov_18.499022_6_plen_35_part_00
MVCHKAGLHKELGAGFIGVEITVVRHNAWGGCSG